MDRRNFVKALGLGGASAPLLLAASGKMAQADEHIPVVIVGGGMAGATAAKYLCFWGMAQNMDVRVTLVDQNPAYLACILSNEVIVGQRTLAQQTFTYDALLKRFHNEDARLKFVHATVTRVDTAAKAVILSNGETLRYKRLILAPGVDFNYTGIAITSANPAMNPAQALAQLPHAYKAGPQTLLLQQQLAAMTDGNQLVITIPKAPYRAPAAPYERACVIADWMMKNKPNSKVVVLDANPKIIAEPLNFGAAFAGVYAKTIEYHPNIQLQSVNVVNAKTKVVTASDVTNPASPVTSTVTAEVVNLIPPMQAGNIVTQTLAAGGLSADGRWALVNELSYESPAFPGVHVIGDSISSAQTKTGHISNEEAKVCADAILRLEAGMQPYATPMTNSNAYTPITTPLNASGGTATFTTAVYRYNPAVNPATGKPFGMQIVSGNPVGTASESMFGGTPTTAPGATLVNYQRMTIWFAQLTADTFA